jgi:catenin alpha
LTQEQRDKINEELSSLRKEKTNFDREVLKWDEQSNEIVVLAKQMCVIMMDMIKFSRGIGPYKTTMDVINAAKRINEIGLTLEKLCRKLASDCPESQSKKELLNYLGQLPLFCNQLSIGTKVQENIIDVRNIQTRNMY